MATEICKNGNIHLIGVPDENVEAVSRVVIKSFDEAMSSLKYFNKVDVVVIEAQDFFVISQLGIGGSAIGKSCIEIRIDFSRKDLDNIIKVEIPATIYHELSHIIRENNLKHGGTLLDSMVSEGIACYIEQLAVPREIPYIKPIEYENNFWNKAKESFNDSNYDHSVWFFGAGELPNWIGYRLGYLLVKEYMQKNNKELSELSLIPSKEILQGSGL
jgi:hypothetical protein